MKRKNVVRFFIAGFLFLFSATLVNAQQKAGGISRLPNQQVCMITNKFMSKDQLAVPVNGNVYYGCCEGCVSKLKNNAAARTATDALTQKKVDKATAFIVVKPGTKDDVLYFASKGNAEKYLKGQAQN